MKRNIFLLILTLTILFALIYGAGYVYLQIAEQKLNLNQNQNENNVYTKQEENLIANVEPFLFTNRNLKLFYEGGPVHWGSRTITFNNLVQTDNSKIVTLNVTDESDLKGDTPKKQWQQKWEVKTNGTLYIDDVLMLKSPISVNTTWQINSYSPIVVSDKKYTANIKITNIEENINNENNVTKKVTTQLTINDLKTVDGGIYTETRVFETGIGLREVKVTEPTISNLILTYFLQSSTPINNNL